MACFTDVLKRLCKDCKKRKEKKRRERKTIEKETVGDYNGSP